jgi:hypothetical protein
MRNHVGNIRGFSQLSKAYYASTFIRGRTIDEITIGMYSEEGGSSGEFSVVWEVLDGEIVPRLNVWNDSWSALAMFEDLTDWMASIDSERISPDDFCDKLRSLKIVDRTLYV